MAAASRGVPIVLVSPKCNALQVVILHMSFRNCHVGVSLKYGVLIHPPCVNVVFSY